jgi:hypothetical protein
MYKVLVVFDSETSKIYEFDEFEFAKEVFLHAKENGLNALIIDKDGNVIILK